MDEQARLSEQFKKVRDYHALLESAPYQRLAAHLASQVADITERAVGPGFEGVGDEHDALVKARALSEVLRYVESEASHLPRLEAKLKEVGIATS